MRDTSLLTKHISQLNITLTDAQLAQFNAYYNLLIETNKVMNLTAVTEYEDVVLKHFTDSLTLVKIYDNPAISSDDYSLNRDSPLRVIDIGTGAGFPGIPLKIAYPDMDITLLDSLGKRVLFLDSVINELNLNENGYIEAVNSRAEDYVKEDNIRESYDLAVSRAVADLAVLCEYALPYVRIGGSFISYKSENMADELNGARHAIEILGGEITRTESFTLPHSDINRTLIEIKKTRPTPEKYPRRAGLPTKKPIK